MCSPFEKQLYAQHRIQEYWLTAKTKSSVPPLYCGAPPSQCDTQGALFLEGEAIFSYDLGLCEIISWVSTGNFKCVVSCSLLSFISLFCFINIKIVFISLEIHG